MRKSTSIFKAVLIALFAVSLGVEMVSAAGFPSVKDLYGRYKFSGECSYVDMVSGAAGEAPGSAPTTCSAPARLRFLPQRIIIWPCCRANQRMK